MPDTGTYKALGKQQGEDLNEIRNLEKMQREDEDDSPDLS